MTPELREGLRNEIHAKSFTPAPESRCVGVEVELLAHDSFGRPVPLLENAHSIVPLLRNHAAQRSWCERAGYGAVPSFEIPGRAIVSFEPGGQIEISSFPSPSVSTVVRSVRSIVSELREALGRHEIELLSVGIDARNEARDIPLQLHAERYEKMTRYFESIGPFGIRMMRQTAAIQVSLDRGAAPATRWRLLNDLAPYVVAIFANSPTYQWRATGHQSFRAHCWRQLDPSRTGPARPSKDAASSYVDFALAANDMFRSVDGCRVPFADRDSADFDRGWETHLTTLFPEVRPRGHYEVRSCDALMPVFYAAPIVFLASLAYDETATREALDLTLGDCSRLKVAGEDGVHDDVIGARARDLWQIAFQGAARLGESFIGSAELEAARTFYDIYTKRGRAPADDAVVR